MVVVTYFPTAATSTRTDTATGVATMTKTAGGAADNFVTLAMFAIASIFAEQKEVMSKYE